MDNNNTELLMNNLKKISNITKQYFTLLLLSLTLLLTGCGGSAPHVELESSNYSIRMGETVTLTWNAESDDSDVASQKTILTALGDVAVSGSGDFSPESSTVYTLTDIRTSIDGKETIVTKEITVHVDLLLADWVPKDRNFERCVKEQNEGSLYALDVRLVNCSNVSSLEGVEYLGELGELSILTGRLNDISPLKTLYHLSNLRFASVPISDLEPIGDLQNIFTLIVIDTSVTDVSPIGRLNGLLGVWLGMNNITDGLIELEPVLAQMSEYSGWVDLQVSVLGVEDTNKRIDCEYLNEFRSNTQYEDNVFWPAYCD